MTPQFGAPEKPTVLKIHIISKSHVRVLLHATFPKSPTNQQNIANYVKRNFQKKELRFGGFLSALLPPDSREINVGWVEQEEKAQKRQTARQWTVGETLVCPMHARPSINKHKRTGFVSFHHGTSNSSLEAHPSSTLSSYGIQLIVAFVCFIDISNAGSKTCLATRKTNRKNSSYSIHENRYYT